MYQLLVSFYYQLYDRIIVNSWNLEIVDINSKQFLILSMDVEHVLVYYWFSPYFKLVWKIKLFNYSKILALHNANIIIVILRDPKAM